MKKIIICLMGAIFLLSAGMIHAKKAGEVIGDSIYHDLNYDFKIKLVPGWEVAKVKNDKDILRVMITKKNPVVPSQFSRDQSYFTRPQLTILADSVGLAPDSIMDLIMAQERDIKIVKEALKNFALISYSENEPTFGRVGRVDFGDYAGLFVDCRKDYRYNLNLEGRIGSQFVQGFLTGRIYVLKLGTTAIIMEQISERERYGFNEREFEAMVRSIGEDKKEAAEDEASQNEKPEKKAPDKKEQKEKKEEDTKEEKE